MTSGARSHDHESDLEAREEGPHQVGVFGVEDLAREGVHPSPCGCRAHALPQLLSPRLEPLPRHRGQPGHLPLQVVPTASPPSVSTSTKLQANKLRVHVGAAPRPVEVAAVVLGERLLVREGGARRAAVHRIQARGRLRRHGRPAPVPGPVPVPSHARGPRRLAAGEGGGVAGAGAVGGRRCGDCTGGGGGGGERGCHGGRPPGVLTPSFSLYLGACVGASTCTSLVWDVGVWDVGVC